jgi:hypothetical protein
VKRTSPLRHTGAVVKLVDESKSPEELQTLVKKFAPHLVCFSCTVTECLPAALEMIVALRNEFPDLTIFAGGRAALWDASKMLKAGCDKVCGSREEARHAMRQFAVTRARLPPTNQGIVLQA